MTEFDIEHRTLEGYRAEWDALRGSEHSLDYKRAVFLWDVLVVSLHDNVENLRKFIVNVLDEFPGKRTDKFIRMTLALEKFDDPDLWSKIGGNGVVLLSRVDGRKRSRIKTRVNQTLKDTGRNSVSDQTFRNILKSVLGTEGYRSILTERRSDHIHPITDYRSQVITLQGAILDLLTVPGVRERLSDKVRILVGMASKDEEKQATRRQRRRAS